MQPEPKQSKNDAWFVYSRRAGKITAAPVNAKGWATLAACLTIIIVASWAVAGLAFEVHPALAWAGLFVVIAGGVLITVKIAMAKGRQLD